MGDGWLLGIAFVIYRTQTGVWNYDEDIQVAVFIGGTICVGAKQIDLFRLDFTIDQFTEFFQVLCVDRSYSYLPPLRIVHPRAVVEATGFLL